MNQEYRIRGATAADLPAVRALLVAAGLPPDGLEEQFGPQYVVAEAGGAPIAAAGLERYGPYGLLRSVAVAPAWRGRGVGEAMVRDRLAEADALGTAAVYLLTITAADYFPRYGFVPVDREELPAEIRGSREFVSACPASAVAMRRGARP